MGMAFLSVGFVAAVVVLLTLLRAWVISLLWGWYAVRLGLPPITMAWAVGLSALVSSFMRTYPPKEDKAKGVEVFIQVGSRFLDSVGYSLLCLFLGWVALQWMPVQ